MHWLHHQCLCERFPLTVLQLMDAKTIALAFVVTGAVSLYINAAVLEKKVMQAISHSVAAQRLATLYVQGKNAALGRCGVPEFCCMGVLLVASHHVCWCVCAQSDLVYANVFHFLGTHMHVDYPSCQLRTPHLDASN